MRVLTTDVFDDRSLPLEISQDRVIYTEYRERRHWPDRIVRWFRGRPAAVAGDRAEDASPQYGVPARSLRQTLRRHYLGLIHIPDMRADWISTAIPAGRQLIKEWKPDIIFASAPPHTGLIIASRLARACKVPWVADFRDLWVDNPYYSEPGWRKRMDAMLERRILRRAAGLVTVSPIWAEQLQSAPRKNAQVVFNGYAEEDFPPSSPRSDRGEMLTVRYMGSIYPGFRDPSPLFAAIASAARCTYDPA